MVRIFVVLVLLILSFVGGVFYERSDQRKVGELNSKITALELEAVTLKQHNEQLSETLKLVKRQIQTDRIAYQELQKIVEESESGQSVLKQQLEDQRELLKKLRKKLEQPEE
jgi:chaperonin cofactor prefoldin